MAILLTPRDTLKLINYTQKINDIQKLIAVCFDIGDEKKSNFWWFAHKDDEVLCIMICFIYYIYYILCYIYKINL